MNVRHKNKMTLIGMVAILLWGMIVGLIRSVSENFGPVAGAALIYSVASLILFFFVGFPKLRSFPRGYLIWGSLLFVSYELCLALSIGYANTGQQAIEVGMVNYLWPTFTLVAAILFNQQRTTVLIYPGVFISMLGIFWVLGGNDGFSLPNMLNNIYDNPLSYGLAFLGAIIWSVYSIITAKFAAGKNGITFFFILVALALWIKYLLAGGGVLVFSAQSIIPLLLAACAMGFGYAAWNVGIMYGNVTVLAGASYFTPVLSAALAALILRTPLSSSFWQGTLMICGGSILCWVATQTAPRPNKRAKSIHS